MKDVMQHSVGGKTGEGRGRVRVAKIVCMKSIMFGVAKRCASLRLVGGASAAVNQERERWERLGHAARTA